MPGKLAVALLLIAVTGSPQGFGPEPAGQEPMARVTMGLVQLDVIVTGHDGRHVSALKPEDFESLENGKPQRITNF